MADRVGHRLGNYQLIRLLGSGSFADVYLGEHIHLGMQAALKVLTTRLTNDDIENFRTEARTIARLKHPQIVRVLEFGVESGTPFLVMDYAPYGTLRTRHPRGSRLAPETFLPYVKQVAEALQYAHEQKLIHRDIKPENMLLGERHEVLLSDFGIAMVAQSSRYQGTQEVAGTVAYMAPEQAQGHPRPASDQYSLGVVVYEWLAGEQPFHGSFTEIAIQHVLAPPPPPHEKVPGISPQIEQVVMTALAKDPKERFATVQEFAHALEQGIGGIAPAYFAPTQVMGPSASAPTDVVPPGRLPGASSATPRTFPDQPTLVVAPAHGSGTVLPPQPQSARAGSMGATLLMYRRHSDCVNAVAWSPDGRRIASGSSDKQVEVWDTSNGGQIFIYRGHSAAVNAVAWSPDGQDIASGGGERSVSVWMADNGILLFSYSGHSDTVAGVAWSPDGQYIASASADKTIHVWVPTDRGRRLATYSFHTDAVYGVAWSPDGRYIASVGADKTLQVWDTTGRQLFVCQGHTATVHAVAWSPDGQRVTSGGADSLIQIWDGTSGTHLLTCRGQSNWICALAWSPDGRYIASGSRDNTARIWDAATGELVYTYRGHAAAVSAVAWSSDGTRIASGGMDNTVHIWQTV